MNRLIPQHLSLIVSTYNRPDALHAVLMGLAAQSVLGFEVVVADDGSTESTAALIHELTRRVPYSLRHVWQPDEGFRVAAVRNRALAAAKGAYIVFLDGDCIPGAAFIRQHCRLAQPGWFVAGNRILCAPEFTRRILAQNLPLWAWKNRRWGRARLNGDINRLLPLLCLPDGMWRTLRPLRWQGVKTCNLGVWRQDLLDINGFDEHYQGWGHEDADLAVRLFRHGVRRKEGRFAAPVFHLWHPQQDRSAEADNRRRLHTALTATATPWAQRGLDQYLS